MVDKTNKGDPLHTSMRHRCMYALKSCPEPGASEEGRSRSTEDIYSALYADGLHAWTGAKVTLWTSCPQFVVLGPLYHMLNSACGAVHAVVLAALAETLLTMLGCTNFRDFRVSPGFSKHLRSRGMDHRRSTQGWHSMLAMVLWTSATCSARSARESYSCFSEAWPRWQRQCFASS